MDDKQSVFSYDGEGKADAFSISQLRIAVETHFKEPCTLAKLAEGGYHKVYDIIRGQSGVVDAVVRVACPAFPKDKLESEVATLQFLEAHAKVPVPRVHAWNSDASNPVGAEYVIMEKIPGVPASDKWETLPVAIKIKVVAQVAEYLVDMFSHRFDRAGSLYRADPAVFFIGPIVSTPFYRALDGVVRIPDSPLASDLDLLRGPYANVSEYLSSFLRAELRFVSQHRSTALLELGDGDEGKGITRLEQGERVLNKAIELCSVYPGDLQVYEGLTTPGKLFAIKMDDFRLSNVMIDESSGRVNGFIDFEGATIAPLWESANIPRWLLPVDDPESSYEGGKSEDREVLRDAFLSTLDRVDPGGEWRKTCIMGRPFRLLVDRLNFQVNVWASDDLEAWVDERLLWAKEHSGVGFPEGGPGV